MGKATKSQTEHTFSCMNCGHPFTVYPPQTGYDEMLLEPCENEPPTHNKVMTVDCDHCHQRTKIYWCPGHSYFASV